MHRKAPWRSKREGGSPHSKWYQVPISLFTRIHLGWEMSTDTWGDPESERNTCSVRPNRGDGSLPGSSVHGISQARILEGGSHSLLQGVFPTQGWNPHLSHCRQILYHPSHQRSLREDPETHQIQTQNQANQNDWPNKTRKKCHKSNSNYHEDAT